MVLVIFLILIIGSFFGFARSLSIPTLFDQFILAILWIAYSKLYIQISALSPVEQTKRYDDHILDLTFFLLKGKEEFYVKIYFSYLIYIFIDNNVALISKNRGITIDNFMNIFQLNIFFAGLTTFGLRFAYKKMMEKELAKKPYLFQRSIFRYKPIFN
ncbi:MAG: hypothetical protein Q8S31_02900 [Alphaproteobacteria bacterium]|nr:hypothetical protein [Alphaproteobacteria bacterium]